MEILSNIWNAKIETLVTKKINLTPYKDFIEHEECRSSITHTHTHTHTKKKKKKKKKKLFLKAINFFTKISSNTWGSLNIHNQVHLE
jgi:hypothetical protein